ncbi:MAG: hypothetical protein E7539_05955 [Ruminococcaceae bacterium]|nr:hypothetical protein [Oscillospiraceae bacterium]
MAAYVTNLPVNGKFNVTAVFGEEGSLWKNGHKGIDITADERALYSVCDGEVSYVGYDANGWGRYVSIKPAGFERIRIILCHLVNNSAKVKKGDKVSRTTKIGTMGTTGNSTGVHVHVEMRVDNTAVDPTPYLKLSNNKAAGLIDTDYKVDAKTQSALLTEILNSFDNKMAQSNVAELESLKTQLEFYKTKLAQAESKIENAKRSLA